MSRYAMLAASAAIVCVIAVHASAGELVLAENGRSTYRIVLAENASPSTKHGAEELQSFLEQMTGAKLPIISDQTPQGAQEIILGDNAHLRALGVAVDFAALGQEGYVIRTVGNHLVIAGGQLRGNLYGVYGFLEDHLGCRWFAPGVSRIPKSARLAVGPIDDHQVPALEYREPRVYECYDGDWCARNRMNSSNGWLQEKHGGKLGIWCSAHSYQWLMPVEKYFNAHPEYYSLVGGKRQKENPQLCCTNPDVIRICTEAIRELMRSKPENTVFSVSQNDWNNHCECPNCQELAQQEDSQIGPVLYLANRVAEGVEKEFPDKIVQTLAYCWSQRPPKHMRPRPNVVIMLCPIGCCFSHPLPQCDSGESKAFRANLEGWSKVAPRLWIWNYGTDFANYLLPFPNQRVRGPNIRFFVANNVKGISEQDTYDTADSELWALGGYMTAKLLWNPNYDADKAMNEFLEAYYGKAAMPIRAYIDLLHDHVEQQNIHVNLWAKADSPHLNDELLAKADQLWQRAETLVAAEPEAFQRVQRSRMSVDYAIMERSRLEAKKELPANEALAKLAAERFEPFCKVLQASPLSRLKEYDPVDKATYRRDLAKDLGIALP